MNWLYRVVRTIAWPIVRIVFRVKVEGLENIPKQGGIILCCNHTSMTDIAFLIVTCKRMIHFMGKQELFKNKLVGAFFRAMGGFAVERGSGGGEAIENAIQLVKDGNVMCIFPEGTRSRDGKPMRAKSGVAVIASGTGEMVLPVAIYREGKIRPFCRATIRYGIPINASETKMQDGSRGELKRISGLIMDRIVELWKKGF